MAGQGGQAGERVKRRAAAVFTHLIVCPSPILKKLIWIFHKHCMNILLISITESFGKSLARRTLVPALGPGAGQPRTHRVAREGLPLGVARAIFGDGFSGR